MIKYILIMKICSVVHGDCLPEYNAGTFDTWYDSEANATINTGSAMAEIGPDLVNSNKIYVTFKCKQANET